MKTDDMRSYRRVWVSGCCILAAAIQIATTQASLAWAEATSPMKRGQQEPAGSLNALSQQAGDFIDFDKNLNEEDARRTFLSVLWEVRIKLASFGESIPIEFMRSLIRRGGNDEIIRFFKPGQTDPLLAAVADLEELNRRLR